MIAIGLLFVRMLCDYFKPRPQLEAEIVILRHQLNLLQRRAPRRRHLRWVDRGDPGRTHVIPFPWQNGYVERFIGSIRRECTDHLLVFNAEHLRRIPAKYATYYNEELVAASDKAAQS